MRSALNRKKRIALLLAVALAVVGLSGCGEDSHMPDGPSGETNVSPTASSEEGTGESEPSSDEEPAPGEEKKFAYGETAYRMMGIIDSDYPSRINGAGQVNNSNKLGLADYILQTMHDGGYTEKVYTYTQVIEDIAYTCISYAFTKEGKRPEKIVIGAHYDSADLTDGPVELTGSTGVSDNASGVGLTLELAERFRNIETDYTLEFCFWDGEEYLGAAGSASYVMQLTEEERRQIALYINLDCVAFGDEMYAYGGAYENGHLVRTEGYVLAMEIAAEKSIPLKMIPSAVGEIYPEMRAPTRTISSDHYYFNEYDIPYLYMEANAWVNQSGEVQNPLFHKPYQYNSTNAAFLRTEGQINHTLFDRLSTLEAVLGNQGRENIARISEIVTEVIIRWGKD